MDMHALSTPASETDVADWSLAAIMRETENRSFEAGLRELGHRARSLVKNRNRITTDKAVSQKSRRAMLVNLRERELRIAEELGTLIGEIFHVGEDSTKLNAKLRSAVTLMIPLREQPDALVAQLLDMTDEKGLRDAPQASRSLNGPRGAAERDAMRTQKRDLASMEKRRRAQNRRHRARQLELLASGMVVTHNPVIAMAGADMQTVKLAKAHHYEYMAWRQAQIEQFARNCHQEWEKTLRPALADPTSSISPTSQRRREIDKQIEQWESGDFSIGTRAKHLSGLKKVGHGNPRRLQA